MAILIHKFTKKRKTAAIGFVMGTVGTIIIDLLMIMGGSNDKILAFLLSASITLTLVVISIILLEKNKDD